MCVVCFSVNGQPVTSEWTHMVLSVSQTGITTFIDGHPVRQYGYHRRMDPTQNTAYPDPTTLNTPLTSFTMGPTVRGSVALNPVYIG